MSCPPRKETRRRCPLCCSTGGRGGGTPTHRTWRPLRRRCAGSSAHSLCGGSACAAPASLQRSIGQWPLVVPTNGHQWCSGRHGGGTGAAAQASTLPAEPGVGRLSCPRIVVRGSSSSSSAAGPTAACAPTLTQCVLLAALVKKKPEKKHLLSSIFADRTVPIRLTSGHLGRHITTAPNGAICAPPHERTRRRQRFADRQFPCDGPVYGKRGRRRPLSSGDRRRS